MSKSEYRTWQIVLGALLSSWGVGGVFFYLQLNVGPSRDRTDGTGPMMRFFHDVASVAIVVAPILLVIGIVLIATAKRRRG